ncbi:MAG: leucine-rich repeat domain-containing protein [Spirochaetaceae bacterium]|nr:leucine-rich repeat domain-containing protein [Spirochaetaceae bacterium]
MKHKPVFALIFLLFNCDDSPPDPNPPFKPADDRVNIAEFGQRINEFNLEEPVKLKGSWESFKSGAREVYPNADSLGKLYKAIEPLANSNLTIALDFSYVTGENIEDTAGGITSYNWRKPNGRSPAIRRIILPADMHRIGNYAFYQCDNLAAISFSGSAAPNISDTAFERSSNKTMNWFVPSGAQANYSSLKSQFEARGFSINISSE